MIMFIDHVHMALQYWSFRQSTRRRRQSSVQGGKNQVDLSTNSKNDEKSRNFEKSDRLTKNHPQDCQPSGFQHQVILPTPTFRENHHLGQSYRGGELLPMVEKEHFIQWVQYICRSDFVQILSNENMQLQLKGERFSRNRFSVSFFPTCQPILQNCQLPNSYVQAPTRSSRS